MTPRYPDTTGVRRRIAVYAGSFDPFTRGHLDSGAGGPLRHFIIAVGYNAAKAPSPDGLGHRVGAIESALRKLSDGLSERCRVELFRGV